EEVGNVRCGNEEANEEARPEDEQRGSEAFAQVAQHEVLASRVDGKPGHKDDDAGQDNADCRTLRVQLTYPFATLLSPTTEVYPTLLLKTQKIWKAVVCPPWHEAVQCVGAPNNRHGRPET